jgi:DNA-directed RNA polymerase subunit E'
LYNIYTVKDVFKMSPEYFDQDIEKVAANVLQGKYEGRIDKDMGVIIAVFNVRNISDGTIYPGDPSTHHEAEFDVLSYMPHVDEIVSGQVTELVEFGAFVRIGPMDGLVHVSQIAGDFLSFDKKNQAFVSKRSGINLKKGDTVYAKVSTVSMKNTIKDSKIALTMKHDGLGKPEWANIPEGKQRSRKPGGGSRRKPN